MQLIYVSTLIKSFNFVLDSFSSSKILSTDIKIPRNQAATYGITVNIGFVGDIDAKIYMSMNTMTGLSLASEMLGGLEMTEIDELAVSAVAEFCNMIMGNACSRLSGHNMVVDITPPVVMIDQMEFIYETDTSYTISIQLEKLGKIDFDVALLNVS